MRKIVSHMFISLDGAVAEPETWQFPYFNEEMGAEVPGGDSPVDALLLGRVTYEIFAGAWPTREKGGGPDAAMGKHLGDSQKIVVSHSDLDFTWRNSERLTGGLIEGVATRKAEPGGIIAMSGSPSIVVQLLDAGLLDELHLMMHPIAVRHGKRLFDDGDTVPLQLVSAQTFTTGVLNLVYRREDPGNTNTYTEAREYLRQGWQASGLRSLTSFRYRRQRCGVSLPGGARCSRATLVSASLSAGRMA